MESKNIIDELMSEVDKKMCLDSPKEAGIYRRILKKAILEAKKEVFDDIEKVNKVHRFLDDYNKYYQELKKRHLSTFQKKSDIIAVNKQTAVMDNI